MYPTVVGKSIRIGNVEECSLVKSRVLHDHLHNNITIAIFQCTAHFNCLPMPLYIGGMHAQGHSMITFKV